MDTLASSASDLKPFADSIARQFDIMTGLSGTAYEILERMDGQYLRLSVGHPSERFYAIVNQIAGSLPESNPFARRISLKKTARKPWLLGPEVGLLQRVLSESLTVGRQSFKDDFFDRYIKSLFGAEENILARGNHLVFGRRGSGKSSLLLYGMRMRELGKHASVWISMQTYERRADRSAIIEVLQELLGQLSQYTAPAILAPLISELTTLHSEGEQLTEHKLRQVIPKIRDVVVPVAKANGDLYVFIDDLHVVDPALQPELISVMYAFSRGNGVYLKFSAIENFTQNWDPQRRIGLEVPNDAQVIRLDYNLTEPIKAKAHIESILHKHAVYCGIPSLAVLCGSDVMSRLVWVGAGVPRDAINIFLQAIVKSIRRSHKKVTVMSVNMAASDNLDEKTRFMQMDSSASATELNLLIERLKEFCREQRSNAFLVRIANNDVSFQRVLKLIDLRLLHVINPGITPDEAGEKFTALVLDYGFYVSMRSARSIDLFQKGLQTPTAKQLRKLPQFRL